MPARRHAGDDDPLLTGPQAAKRAGLDASTWRNYRKHGLVPAPDEPGDEDGAIPPNRRSPKWRTSTVDHFRANRLGAGRRTDLGR